MNRNCPDNNKAFNGKSLNMLTAQGITKILGGAENLKEQLEVSKFRVLSDRGVAFNFKGSYKANYVIIKQNKSQDCLYDMGFYKVVSGEGQLPIQEIITFTELKLSELRSTFECFTDVRMTRK